MKSEADVGELDLLGREVVDWKAADEDEPAPDLQGRNPSRDALGDGRQREISARQRGD
jgi:hypothetical protein